MGPTRHRWVLIAAIAAVVVVIGGFGVVRVVRHEERAHTPADRRPILGVSPGESSEVAISAALDKGVPVGNGNFADPFVLLDGSEVYAYATNVRGANIPVSRSLSATEAKYLGDAMPTLPKWTSPGAVWAPSVYARADGTYVMFYASTYGLTDRQCLGRAVANSPAGPFVDDTTEPFVCPLDLGGAIDPSMITVDGKPWLVYKSDGNCCSLPTKIWSAPLSADLLSVVGPPSELIVDDQSWEDGVVEGPEMIQVGDELYLFYSGNDWATANYAVGYAVCQSVTGPCTKPLDKPFHASTSDAAGPGGQTFFTVDDHVGMGFHAWLPDHVDTRKGERRLYLGQVTFDGSTPTFVPYG